MNDLITKLTETHQNTAFTLCNILNPHF